MAKEVLQWIGAFKALKRAIIVSYNMQDYEFWGKGLLSSLLVKQLSHGADITIMTTPPPGSSGGGTAFKRKYRLLEQLDKYGAKIYLHPLVHAKAYLFQDSRNSEIVMVGSPNLTSGGFGAQVPNIRTYLEIALLTGDPRVYSSTEKLIQTDLIGNIGTADFATWTANNRSAIARAKGAP